MPTISNGCSQDRAVDRPARARPRAARRRGRRALARRRRCRGRGPPSRRRKACAAPARARSDGWSVPRCSAPSGRRRPAARSPAAWSGAHAERQRPARRERGTAAAARCGVGSGNDALNVAEPISARCAGRGSAPGLAIRPRDVASAATLVGLFDQLFRRSLDGLAARSRHQLLEREIARGVELAAAQLLDQLGGHRSASRRERAPGSRAP